MSTVDTHCFKNWVFSDTTRSYNIYIFLNICHLPQPKLKLLSNCLQIVT